MKFASFRTYMRLPKPAFCAAVLLASSWAAAQTDIRITEVFVCDASGLPSTAKVGEPFWVAARFQVVGEPSSRFKFRVETAYAKIDTARLSFGVTPGSYWVSTGPISTLMDGPVEVKATLDPERKLRVDNRQNNSVRLIVQPETPISALQYFDPQTVQSRFGSTTTFYAYSAVPSSVTCWLPIPESDGFQQVLSAAPAFMIPAASEPFGQSIGTATVTPSNLNAISFEASFQTTASAARINFAMLKLLGSSTDPNQSEWLAAERLVEVGKPEFRAWITSVFPSGTGGLSTVEVARKIYRSILMRTYYEFRPGVAPSALRTLRDRKGDCGGLSSLFVALCRTAGIPSRTVAGFAKGANNWHVWAEFHVAGAGWIPVDPSYAESMIPNGSDLPIYFGVIPELNERVATAFGLDRRLGGLEMPMLQSPAVFWTGPNVRVQRVAAFSNLTAN